MKIIDVHTHGIGGYDTRTLEEKDILAIAATHGSLGVAEIVLAIYPAAIKVMRKHMDAVRKAMELQKAAGAERRASRAGSRGPSKIIGVHLEGPFLNPVHCGALDVTTFLEPEEYHIEKLIDGFEDIIKIITIAPELKGATGAIRKIVDKGIIPSMGHSAATYSEAENGFNAGARGITHIFNAMRSFHHREPGIAGFGLLNQEVYIEVIADPFHLHRATIDLILKVKNPSRIIIISDSVSGSKMPGSGQGVTAGSGRLAGGSMTIIESARQLVEIGFEKNAIMKCVTVNPKRYLSN
jgi:N-acetylglucosamine-6-phosphate deacetylase